MRVKVCGIRRRQDVALAAKLGVDAVGLLVGQRHRSEDFLEPQEARELADACPPLMTPVLVTHYEEPDAVVHLARELLVTTIQMHSECSATALRKIRSQLPGVRLIRAVHATSLDAIELLRELSECVHGFIIDSVNPKEDRVGGTGLTHDWNLSARIVAACPLPVVLAGGLDATNVAAAIATVRPYAVDANTRLRDAHGFKSPEKVGAFVRSAKAAFFDLALQGEPAVSTDSAVLSQARYLQKIQNDDGGWGIEAGYPSSPTNTAEVLMGLHMAAAPVAAEVERKATEFLTRHQCVEGGWGSRSQGGKAGTSRTVPTAWAIRALSKCAATDETTASLNSAWTYLLAQQQSSGAWTERSNTVESVTATCHALHALLTGRDSGERPQKTEAIGRGLTWLEEVQQEGRIGFTAVDKPRLPTTVYAAFVATRAAKQGVPHHLSRLIDNVRRTAQQARPRLFQTEVERPDLGTFPSQYEHFTVPVLIGTLLAIGEQPSVLWPFMRQLWKLQTLGRGVSCEPGGRHTTWATAQWLRAMSDLKQAATKEPQLLVDYESMSSEERALVLKGGGVKGLALAGAVAALEEQGQRFDLFAGTSAGAIGALLLAAGYTGDELVAELRALNMRDFLDGPLRVLKNLITRGALHTGDPIRRWIRNRIEARLDRTSTVRMRDLGRRALVFAANDDGTVVFDSHGEYRDAPIDFAARCSMSIPFFFADPRHEGEPIYDGGLLNNFPVQELVRVKGDSNFVGLYLKGTELTGLGRALKVFRIVRILLNRDEQRTVEQYRDQTVIIDPDPIKTTQFSLSDADKDFLIAQGRAAALELLARSEPKLEAEAHAAREKAQELRGKVVAATKARRLRHVLIGLVLVVVIAVVWFLLVPRIS